MAIHRHTWHFCAEHGKNYPDGEDCPDCAGPGFSAPKANERQVVGTHYGKVIYQHWDFATDVNLHYLVGCASKYVLRHQDKNGIQDLEKCLHYLQKADERGVRAMEARQEYFEALARFAAQLPEKERRAVECMCMSNYVEASCVVRELLNELKGITPQ